MPSRRQHSRKQSGRNYIRRYALINTMEVCSAVGSFILYFKIYLLCTFVRHFWLGTILTLSLRARLKQNSYLKKKVFSNQFLQAFERYRSYCTEDDCNIDDPTKKWISPSYFIHIVQWCAQNWVPMYPFRRHILCPTLTYKSRNL